MSRRDSRENALKILFQAEFRKDEDIAGIFGDSIESFDIESDKYTELLVNGVSAGAGELDSLIVQSSKGRSLKRISKIALVIIRIALFEITKVENIPYKVSINEALEIAKKYDEPGSVKFINGVLNNAVTILGVKKDDAGT